MRHSKCLLAATMTQYARHAPQRYMHRSFDKGTMQEGRREEGGETEGGGGRDRQGIMWAMTFWSNDQDWFRGSREA